MRVTFVLLIFIGLIGIINSAFFIAKGSGGGRRFFYDFSFGSIQDVGCNQKK
ncbi:hypothetical protein BVwin_04840 [Bartonella vinsonii subsp. berkhoffii str. Winnie]|nr:hypothetical protein BVwin_04840 [Bartonella vinsonii subsp. berkhoffii str. Winnie]